MPRRLLAQFGLAALALAVSGGMALADSGSTNPSVAPGSSQEQSGSSTVTLSGNGNVSVQVTQASTQQVEGNGSTVNPGSGSTPSSDESSEPSTVTTDSTTISPSTHSSSSGSNGTTPTMLPTTGSGTATNSATAVTSSESPAALAVAIHKAAAIIATQPNPTLVRAVTPTDTPQPPAPGAPRSPVGMLYQLHLMSALIVPASQSLPGLATATALAGILITLGMAARRGGIRRASFSFYTARLRQSGFLGAARSDVAAAHLSFATPLEMGCISRVCAT